MTNWVNKVSLSYFALCWPNHSILTWGTVLRHKCYITKAVCVFVCVCVYILSFKFVCGALFWDQDCAPLYKVYIGKLPFPFPRGHQANVSCFAPVSTPCHITRVLLCQECYWGRVALWLRGQPRDYAVVEGKTRFVWGGGGNMKNTVGFMPGGSDGKESACYAGDLGSIPGLGKFPGEGNGNPLQYSCLENPMGRGVWQATVHEVAKSQTWLSN